MAGDRPEDRQGRPQITHEEREHAGSGRDPEERPAEIDQHLQIREKAHDKTLADSFPTSDPPSTIPDPGEEDPYAA